MVQGRIDDCESLVKKYSAELVVDAEQVKDLVRDYVKAYFEAVEGQLDKIAKVCLFLTESVQLEQGISKQVMKAELAKQRLNSGEKLLDIFGKRVLEEFSCAHHAVLDSLRLSAKAPMESFLQSQILENDCKRSRPDQNYLTTTLECSRPDSQLKQSNYY